MRVSLLGFKKLCWKKRLNGYFIHRGRELYDKEVRAVVNYGISKGYVYSTDIPDNEIDDVLSSPTLTTNKAQQPIIEVIK